MTDAVPTIDPHRTALLVMDYQVALLDPMEGADELLDGVAEAIAEVRRAGGHVGYVRVAFTDEDLAAIPATSRMAAAVATRGTALHAEAATSVIHDRVAPEPGDIVVRKVRVGAFSTTDLGAQLDALGIDTLLLAGIATSGVVLSTLRDASDRDYRVYVVADACADPDPEVHEFLIGRVFPRQAHVVTLADLPGLLGLT